MNHNHANFKFETIRIPSAALLLFYSGVCFMLSFSTRKIQLRIQNSWGNPRLPNRILPYFLPASACVTSFVYFVCFLFVLGYYYAGIFNLIFSVIFLMTFVFYLLDRVTLGKHFLVLTFMTQVSLHSTFFFPKESYFQLLFLAVIPFIFMLFDSDHKKARYFYSSLMILVLAIIQFRIDTRVRPFNFTQTDINLTFNINLASSILMLLVGTLIYLWLMKRKQTESPELSATDPLSGFINRHSFYRLAGELFDLNLLDKKSLSILYIDIDHFRQFKQRYGQSAGDEAILQIAELIKKRSRESDIPARTGGDEFILLLANSNQQSAVLLAQEIVDSAAIAHRAEFNRNLSLSIGIAEMQTEDKNIDAMLARAEKALKIAGHNRVVTTSGN
jgi:diguanylate cyclase (GGDEF)-like protein